MTALQTVVFGAASDGSQGDSVRSAFTKLNANTTVLQNQDALTTGPTITTAQALTVAHIGKRININLSSAATINLPAASTCGADNVILLRNFGTTVATLAITSGSGDTLALSKLNPGETALMDTDGVHAWNVLMRGRTNSDNEIVNGNCTVNGNETVAGTLAVTGQSTFSLRPNFAGKAAWDAGNLPGVPVRSSISPNVISLDWQRNTTGHVSLYVDAVNLGDVVDSTSTQTVTGSKTFQAQTTVYASGNGAVANASLLIQGGAGTSYLGFLSSNNAGGTQLRCNPSTSAIEVVNITASGYNPITCSAVTQASDARLKSNVRTIAGAMEKLRTFRGVYFEKDGTQEVGVIAQEVQPAFPELVHELGMPYEDGSKLLGVKYQNMVGPLLQGLLETDTLVQSLLARIAALEAKQ